jgi:hypothetical protein
VKEQLGKFLKGDMPAIASFVLCLLAVPVLMASQEWDDHDRSKKVLARDLGIDYLESVEKNSILMTFGDNDTYPLWYTQEVEGKRKDLRIINYSLLGTDWYVNQLRYKLNESPPADVIFTAEQIQGNKRDVIPVYPLPGYDQNQYYNLYKILKEVVGSDEERNMVSMQSGDLANVFPVKKVTVPVDVEYVKQNMKFNPGDSIVSELKMDLGKNYLQKNDLALLALIAANNWRRPLYFTSTSELRSLGLDKYLRMEGLAYRLVPVENSIVQNEIAYKNVMEKFVYGNANKKNVYFDEENRRHLNSIKLAHATLAKNLLNYNQLDSAKKVLQKFDQNVSMENMPYGMTSNRGNFHNSISVEFLEAAYRSGDLALAKKVHGSLKKDLEQQLNYYRSLGEDGMNNEQMAMQAAAILNNRAGILSEKQSPFAYDIITSYQFLQQMAQWELEFKGGVPSTEAPGTIQNPGTPPGDTPKRTP